jgi:hypothetical protein
MKWVFLALTFIFGALGYWGYKKNTMAREMVGVFASALGTLSFIFFVAFVCGGC